MLEKRNCGEIRRSSTHIGLSAHSESGIDPSGTVDDVTEKNGISFFEGEKQNESLEGEDSESDDDDIEGRGSSHENITSLNIAAQSQPKVKSWAMMVNPSATPLPNTKEVENNLSGFKKMSLDSSDAHEEKDGCGQFSDAEDDESLEIPVLEDD